MAKPRIFISSTFFDLRQVRTDLERFIKELGYESVRNETGGIPYGKDQRLEEYCYKEISEIDILVGIVGGRFGSEAESGNYSITQTEIKTAIEQNKQIYVFIEKNVLSEYQTYLINKENETTKYRFVDDKRIYKFIEEIYGLPKNNIVHPFETAQDITSFLKEQWAGVFRDLLSQQTKKGQYENISLKVNELTEVASTMRTYLENVLQSVSKEKSKATSLISKEKERLEKFHLRQAIIELRYIDHLIDGHDLDFETIVEKIKETNTLTEFKNAISAITTRPNGEPYKYGCMFEARSLRDINTARQILNLQPFNLSDEEKEQITDDFLPFLKSKRNKDTK